jgi:hypothetical protein
MDPFKLSVYLYSYSICLSYTDLCLSIYVIIPGTLFICSICSFLTILLSITNFKSMPSDNSNVWLSRYLFLLFFCLLIIGVIFLGFHMF